jgi:ATP-binding cassette subfamily F protein uup
VLLKCDGLSKTYREKAQFEEVAFNLCAGDRIGLIGVNGAGKSTLLRCLAGAERPDAGTVERSKTANVIFVEQDPNWGDCLVTDALFDGNTPADKAIRSFFQAQHGGVPEDQKEQALTQATEAMTKTDAWERQFEGMSIANHLSIPEEMFSRRVSTLSGGERKRVALSAALLKHPDALLLDEPTNHLDIGALGTHTRTMILLMCLLGLF